MRKKLFLCSNSPRRFALLSSLGLEFEKVLPAGGGIDENSGFRAPHAVCRDIARAKAAACMEPGRKGVLMGFDTIVVLGGQILGKPASHKAAFDMLRSLGGRRHTVYTGISLIDAVSGRTVCGYERTRVEFLPLRDRDIRKYMRLVNPLDKAGAYNIEEYGPLIVGRVDGCFWNVVGLPLARLGTMLRDFDVDIMEASR